MEKPTSTSMSVWAGWEPWRRSTSSRECKKTLSSTIVRLCTCPTLCLSTRKDQPTTQRKMSFRWGRMQWNQLNRSSRLRVLTNTVAKMRRPTRKSSTSFKAWPQIHKKCKTLASLSGKSRNTPNRSRNILQLTSSLSLSPSSTKAPQIPNSSSSFKLSKKFVRIAVSSSAPVLESKYTTSRTSKTKTRPKRNDGVIAYCFY